MHAGNPNGSSQICSRLSVKRGSRVQLLVSIRCASTQSKMIFHILHISFLLFYPNQHKSTTIKSKWQQITAFSYEHRSMWTSRTKKRPPRKHGRFRSSLDLDFFSGIGDAEVWSFQLYFLLYTCCTLTSKSRSLERVFS